jgi:uncharacterized protein YlzI (FlbEa/FlbD family)
VQLGQVDAKKFPDVCLAMLNSEKVTVKEVKGSIFDGVVHDRILMVSRVVIQYWTKSGSQWGC